MIFKRTVQRYGDTPEPITPYQRAAQEWDDRLGSSRIQASNWRMTAVGALSLATLLAAGMIYQSSKSHITPYVVEVDKLGEARAINAAPDTYNPTDAQIAYYVGRFITNVRSLSTDPVVVRQNWLQAYDFASDRGGRVLTEYARTNDPFANVGSQSVSVQITSVVKAPGSTYQVRWTEQTYKQGNLDKTSRWTAMVTVVTQAPRTADALRKNPLGIYVNGLDWSEELNTAK